MKLLVNTILFLTLVSLYPAVCQETGTFTDARDNHNYGWVKIGDQTWMSENLAWLPSVNRVDDGLFEGTCFYVYGYEGVDFQAARELESYKKYGALYNWDASRQSCPDGWHLPTEQEWQELEKFLGMGDETAGREWRGQGEVGKKLKSTSGWITNTGTDETGFNAKPAGCRGYQGFQSMAYCTYFWTSSPSGGDNAWRRGLCGDDNGVARDEDRRYFGVSVRCMKNKTEDARRKA